MNAVLGLTHAYQIDGNDVDYLFALASPDPDHHAFRAHGIAIGYGLFAACFVLLGRGARDDPGDPAPPEPE